MKIVLLAVSCLTLALFVQGQVRLPRILRDSMVLQRDAKIKVWGWASPGEKVSVKLNGKSAKATAGTDGKWKAELPALKAGGPYTMAIDGSNHLMLKDVLIGDVWLCAGQSNMVHQMSLHAVWDPLESTCRHASLSIL